MKRVSSGVISAPLALTICIVFAAPSSAADLVDFSSATPPPSKFAIEKAKAKGIELKARPGTPLTGYLSEPSGNGPFPAVVLLHGCRGFETYQSEWVNQLTDWGYVALQVDSFGRRGIIEQCAGLDISGQYVRQAEMVFDAYGALDFLRQRENVDANRIALMGWSRDAVLVSVATKGAHQLLDHKFQASVALYPDCTMASTGDFYAPVLALIGEKDDWVLASKCKFMLKQGASGPSPITLKVYPDAYSGFDNPYLGDLSYDEEAHNPNTQKRGATLGYNRSAHEDAVQQVKEFLTKNLR